MLHGGGPGASAWSNFKQNVTRLTARFRLIMIDQPGFGRSDKPVHDRPQHELAAEKILSLLDTLGIEKVTPVGNSIGGAAALEIALQAPQRVDKLVLMAPAGGSLPLLSQPSSESKLMFKFYAGEGASLERMRQLFRGMALRLPRDTRGDSRRALRGSRRCRRRRVQRAVVRRLGQARTAALAAHRPDPAPDTADVGPRRSHRPAGLQSAHAAPDAQRSLGRVPALRTLVSA